MVLQIINYIRAGIRLVLLFTVTLLDIFYLLIVRRFKKNEEDWGLRYRKEVWAKQMMAIGGIRLKSVGKIPPGPHLMVVNHRSSIDPLINLADALCYPIAKIEFKSWPIIGAGSAYTGIVFVDRSSKASRIQTRDAIAEALRNGKTVLIYPEGGTSDKDFTQTFKKGSFEVAAEHGFPVLPVTMEYRDRADNWNHEDNFVVHFFKRFGKRRTHIELRYGPPIISDNSWTLLRQSQAWINGQIEDLRSHWDGPDWKSEKAKEPQSVSQVS